jgi:hypothetical protein
MTNITHITGIAMPDKAEPNPALIEMLSDTLKMAESGKLQCYIGTGFTGDGLRVATWGNFHADKYQMLGSLNWLVHEYVHRTTEENT